jgi:CRP/FNR family transcriptional regulator, cyclic AMP receptor protein
MLVLRMVIKFLRQVPLFSGLDEDALEALAEHVVTRHFPRRAVIILAEQDGDDFFIIRSGQVKVSLSRPDGRELILSFLGEGAVFGELSLLDGKPRSASVTATRETELLMLRRVHLLSLLHAHPRMAAAMLAELASRLRRTDDQIGYLALCNVTHRVAKTIVQLAMDEGVECEDGLLLRQRPTHEDLARLTGTTRETVTRVLGRLERDGYLVRRGRELLVLREGVEPQDPEA